MFLLPLVWRFKKDLFSFNFFSSFLQQQQQLLQFITEVLTVYHLSFISTGTQRYNVSTLLYSLLLTICSRFSTTGTQPFSLPLRRPTGASSKRSQNTMSTSTCSRGCGRPGTPTCRTTSSRPESCPSSCTRSSTLAAPFPGSSSTG